MSNFIENVTLDQKRKVLASLQLEATSDSSRSDLYDQLKDIFWGGFTGYKDMPESDINDEWNDIVEQYGGIDESDLEDMISDADSHGFE